MLIVGFVNRVSLKRSKLFEQLYTALQATSFPGISWVRDCFAGCYVPNAVYLCT
jgi:hypothetical protein